MCGTLILFDLESFVLFSCNMILFQSVDIFFQYLHTIKCFITVRVDWFPFTEQHLKKDKLLSDNNRILFNTHPYYGGGIEDDHIPFLHRSKSSNVFFRLPPLTKTVHTFVNFFLIYVPLYDNKMLLKKKYPLYILLIVCFSTCLYISISVVQTFPSSTLYQHHFLVFGTE